MQYKYQDRGERPSSKQIFGYKEKSCLFRIQLRFNCVYIAQLMYITTLNRHRDFYKATYLRGIPIVTT